MCGTSLVHIPKECKTTSDGKDYMGTKSVTKSGWKCQSWSSDSPQSHGYNDPEDDSMYPDGTAAAAKYVRLFIVHKWHKNSNIEIQCYFC